MRHLTLSVLILALSACGWRPEGAYGPLAPKQVNGNERSVLFTRACGDRAQVYDRAEAHCQRFDRHARLNQVEGCIMSFDCVD